MIQIAYISELPLRPSGGGTFAVNWNAFQQLNKHFPVRSTSPITQHAHFWPSFTSRLNRKLLGRPGAFAFFSKNRLAENAARIQGYLNGQDDAVFFKGATPWINWKPDRPYFAYLDVCFHTFFHNTFQESDFKAADLRRIWDSEARWLEKAEAVFWEANWGREMTQKAYGVDGKRWFPIGRGGNVAPPGGDKWDPQSFSLVTIANNFRQKGGDIVLEAFHQLKPVYPQLTWHIIGGQPTGDWQSVSGITYEGFLHPDNPEHSARFRQLMEKAFLLVHPTREDTNPLVLTEAAYFGCPSVSVRRFAIPELIKDGQTGLLVDFPARASDVATAIEGLIKDQVNYRAMRIAARSDALGRYQWDGIGNRMADIIRRSCGGKGEESP